MAKQINTATILGDLKLVVGAAEVVGEHKATYTNKAEALAADLAAMLKGKSGEAVDQAVAELEAAIAADPILGVKNAKTGKLTMKPASRRYLERAVQSAIKDHGVVQSEVRKAKAIVKAAAAEKSKVAKAAATLGVDPESAKAETFAVSANQKRLIGLMLECADVEVAFTRLIEAAGKGSKSFGVSKELIAACKPAPDQSTVAAQLGKVAKAA